MDEISAALYEAYVMGGMSKGLHSIPCSICQDYLLKHPESDKIDRTEDMHFHSSDGTKCPRKLFNELIFGSGVSFSGANFLMVGHLWEEFILDCIQRGLPDEWHLLKFKNGEERIIEVVGVKVVMHPDAMLVNRNDNSYQIGVECKAVKTKNFEKYTKGFIDELWSGQIQWYMFGYDIEKFYVVVADRDTAKICIPILINRDMNVVTSMIKMFKDIIDRLHTYKLNRDKGIDEQIIINQIQPDRKHSSSKNIECEFCQFKTSCWL